VKLSKFDGARSWAVFHQHLENVQVQNNLTQNEKSTHLFSVLQGEAAVILYTVPAEATYEDIFGAFRDLLVDSN
jgi:hypothetical protein